MRISIPFILSFYLIKKFWMGFLYLTLFLSMINGIFELIDATKLGYPFQTVIQIVSFNVILKIYSMSLYVVLANSVFIFYQMQQNKEFLAYKHIGFSNKQFMYVFTLMLGFVFLIDAFLLNPEINILDQKTEKIETKKEYTSVNFSNTGVWLRDTDLHEYRYIHADKIIPNQHAFENVKVLVLNKDGQLNAYWHAQKAILERYKWRFLEATNLQDKTYSEVWKQTVLTPSDINVFSKQAFIPFIQLTQHIKLFKKLNLSTDYYRLLWHKFVVKYLYLLIMIALGFFIATTIKTSAYLYMATLFSAILIYFISELIFNYLLSYHIDKFYMLWVWPGILGIVLWKRL